MEVSAGKQAKIALEIANKTLPYFQKGESLDSVCKIILESLEAKAVAITDLEKIRASYVVEGIPRIEKNKYSKPYDQKSIGIRKNYGIWKK
ncbi:Inner membrane protein ypdA [Fusobacterium necrophorum subsp. necrophorum]|nr:Inner membrane protein ypdA [Fusobacterium necrophorum subsp. necrophorum]